VALLGVACKEPDPNLFETHVARIKDPSKRAPGFMGLERLTKTVVTSKAKDERLQEFADKVIPVFSEIWDEAIEQQENILALLLDAGRPEGAAIWSRALVLDGSADGRKRTALALDGIKKAKAKACAPAIVEQFEKVIANPKLDESTSEPGKLRILMAQTLGELRDPVAVPVLIKALAQTKDAQPVVVHRAAAEALGKIGDPAAVDALLTVTFRVPDAPVINNIAERVKVALAGVGPAAVPKVLQMLRGEHAEVQTLAAQNDVAQLQVQQTAVGILGAIGSPEVVDELVAFMPSADCSSGPTKRRRAPKRKAADDAEEPDADAVSLRAVTVHALGVIGDPKAAPAICRCLGVTRNPGDNFPMLEALGRMGGPEALSCLTETIRSGEYDSEIVEKGYEYEPRWEAARFAILAARPEDIGAVKSAMASNDDSTVKTELEKWQTGVGVLEECGADKDCYLKTLGRVDAFWFAREKAAFEVAHLAPGDLPAAEAIARAFKVRSADARVTMAWLPQRMLNGTPCPTCVQAYQEVLDAERMSMDPQYQASLLMVWYSTPKLEG